MATPRVSIYDKYGFWLTDIRTSTIRSWALPSRGVIGECTFTLSVNEVKNRQKYLGFGRYVLVRESGLPDWIGIIYTPRTWPYGETTFRAYQAEKVLQWRATQTQALSGTAGN